jgi:asparagine synthase (glutamine-hydrolysing)
MCGISGLINQKSQHISQSDLIKLNNSLKLLHTRGPDAQASCQGNNWLLGHTRLSIIDLEGGKQPMQDTTTGVTLSYNGEIYNFKQLREELIGKGHSFITSSDTEVLLKSYLEWDIQALDKIHGCFAFGIVDPRKNELLLVRDRLGVKPLYYSTNTESIAFASTVEALRAIASSSDLDYGALSHYFTSCRNSFANRTLYKGIKSLPAGSWMKLSLSDNRTSSGRYWQRPVLSAADKRDVNQKELNDKIHSLVSQAVTDRLISDVPVGCFLSGGLDSAVVASEATENSSIKYPFFCAGTSFDKYNEFQYAHEVAQSLDRSVEEVHISSDTFFEDWKMLINQKGLPLSTPNETSIYRLAKTLGQQCKVALTGEGADEIFGGYLMPHFGIHDYLKAPHSEEEAQTDHPLYWKLMHRYGRPYFFNEADHFFLTHSWMPFSQKMKVFEDDFWDAINEDDEVFSYYEDFFDSHSQCTPFDKRMHLHAEVNLEGLLNRVDSSTMAASIEARVPFTDHRLVEYAFMQPDNCKIDFRDEAARKKADKMLINEIDSEDLLETKRLLRQAYKKRVPESVVNRKKMSFPVPFQEWLSGPLASELKEFCIETSKTSGLFKPVSVEEMFNQGDSNIWLIANACLWLKR